MEQLKRILAGLTWRQRITILAVTIAVIGGLVALTRWNRERDFHPLYSGLSAEDAGAVLVKLRELAVEYRVSDNGTTILAPSSKVAETRLQLAAAGLPKSGRIGFEVFDKTNFGTTEFTEQVNYHRALEGELERSIMSLAEVEAARVHLTFAKESVFAELRQPAKASVLVKLRPGAMLPPPKVSAVCSLIASAVEGLDPGAVSLVDMRGNLLNRPRRSPGPDGGDASDAMIEFRQQVERDLLAKINATLEPLLGHDKYRAGVYADCDFTSGEQSEEIFDPTKSVMTNSQRAEDVAGTNAASGVPGTAPNLPRPIARPGSSSGGVSRRTENIAYQASRLVKRTKLPQGGLKRISAAVLVDHLVRWQGEGAKARRIVEPVPPERMKVIRELVSATIGLTAARGDQLTVECLPFESTLTWEPPAPPVAVKVQAIPWLPAWLQNLLGEKNALIWVAGGAGLALLLVLLAAIFVLRRMSRKSTARASAQLALPGARAAKDGIAGSDDDVRKQMEAKLAEQTTLKEKLTAEALNSLKLPQVSTKKTEVLTKYLADEAKKDPVAMGQLVRTWLNEMEP